VHLHLDEGLTSGGVGSERLPGVDRMESRVRPRARRVFAEEEPAQSREAVHGRQRNRGKARNFARVETGAAAHLDARAEAVALRTAVTGLQCCLSTRPKIGKGQTPAGSPLTAKGLGTGEAAQPKGQRFAAAQVTRPAPFPGRLTVAIAFMLIFPRAITHLNDHSSRRVVIFRKAEYEPQSRIAINLVAVRGAEWRPTSRLGASRRTSDAAVQLADIRKGETQGKRSSRTSSWSVWL
jgi:hypothetical protein